MTVTVIFSNGSKSLSHNNDDLRERWELRRQLNIDAIAVESRQGYGIPEIESYGDMEEVRRVRETWVKMTGAVQERLTVLKEIPFYQVQRFALHLREVKVLLDQHLRVTKEIIRNDNVAKNEADAVKRADALSKYVHQLEKAVLLMGGELPDCPLEGWTTWDKLPEEYRS